MNITSNTIKKGLKNNGYTPQKLGFDNRRPFNMGLNSQSEEKTSDSPFKMAETEYWYKINGKPTTKAGYNAYKNKPGGDEPGKSTNDPDPSGNKAKTNKARKNITPKKSTTSAHGQLDDAQAEYEMDLELAKKAKAKKAKTKKAKTPLKNKVSPAVLAAMRNRKVPVPTTNKKGGSGYLTNKGSVANDNGEGERKKTTTEKLNSQALMLKANSGGGPTSLLAEMTGIPSAMRIGESYKKVFKDPNLKNIMSATGDTLGVLPGVGKAASTFSKFVPKLAKYINPVSNVISKVKNANITQLGKKGKKVKVVTEAK